LGLALGARLCQIAKTMKIGANLTEAEAKAFKARKKQELGGGWCVDVYKCQGR
jgi:hypothetical protein